MTRSQNIGKISKNRQNENIIGNISLKASTCIHSYLKKSFFCQKLQFFDGDQRNNFNDSIATRWKITQFRQSEHIFGSFCHQASSCIHSYPKKFEVCRKKINFLVGQNELALMTLSRNKEKSTKVRQSEHIFLNSSLEASSFIHSYPKIFKCCRKVQIFVGGQNELTLMTLSQNSRKNNKIFRMNTFLAVSAFRHLVAPIATQNSQFSSETANFFRWPKWTNFRESIAK